MVTSCPQCKNRAFLQREELTFWDARPHWGCVPICCSHHLSYVAPEERRAHLPNEILRTEEEEAMHGVLPRFYSQVIRWRVRRNTHAALKRRQGWLQPSQISWRTQSTLILLAPVDTHLLRTYCQTYCTRTTLCSCLFCMLRHITDKTPAWVLGFPPQNIRLGATWQTFLLESDLRLPECHLGPEEEGTDAH